MRRKDPGEKHSGPLERHVNVGPKIGGSVFCSANGR